MIVLGAGESHVQGEAIFEQDFLDCSNEFRPGKSCHRTIDQLDKVVMTKPINYIVEVDIEKFFDRIRHYWLLRCIEERVSDPNFLWLIRKFLKAGIVEEGKWIKKVRSMLPLRDWWPILKAKLTGHYNYFGISGNMRSLQQFYSQVIPMVFKWINRRSQKKSMNWQKYQRYLQWYPLPTPMIYHSIYTLSPSR